LGVCGARAHVKSLIGVNSENDSVGMGVTKPEVDEAFEWMVLIIGIISAIMIQYPAYFYTMSPSAAEPSLKAAKAIVIPLVITILIWLVGKLAVSKRIQVSAKVVAWMVVVGVTWVNFYNYMLGLIWASGFHYETTILNDVFVSLGMLLFFSLAPVLTYFVIVPKYREIYPYSALLRSKIKFIVAYAVTQTCLFVLVVGLVS
jgi:hypothetical protein